MKGMNHILMVIMFFLSMTIMDQTRRALVIGNGVQKDTNWTKINGDKDVSYVQLCQAGTCQVRATAMEGKTAENAMTARLEQNVSRAKPHADLYKKN